MLDASHIASRKYSTNFVESPFRIARLAYDAFFATWDETKGLTLDDAKKPMLSRIFLWYAGDFESRGGSPQYAARYAPPGAAKDALATTSPSYFAYDWNLNTQ